MVCSESLVYVDVKAHPLLDALLQATPKRLLLLDPLGILCFMAFPREVLVLLDDLFVFPLLSVKNLV